MQKKPEEYALEYAGFWIRLGAGVIDSIILLLVFYIVYTVISECTKTLPMPFIFILVTIFISFLIKIAYYVTFWVWRGQTPGKLIVGIKVIRTDSSPVTWPYALLRYLGYIVSTIIIFIGFICIAFDERKQGLHDKIADTYVVKLPVRQVELTESLAGGELG